MSFGSFAKSKPFASITSSPEKSPDPGLIISLIAEACRASTLTILPAITK